MRDLVELLREDEDALASFRDTIPLAPLARAELEIAIEGKYRLTPQGLAVIRGNHSSGPTADDAMSTIDVLIRSDQRATCYRNFAIADAYNSVHWNYGERSNLITQRFGEGIATRTRIVALVGRRTPVDVRCPTRVRWKVYEIISRMPQSLRAIWHETAATRPIKDAELLAAKLHRLTPGQPAPVTQPREQHRVTLRKEKDWFEGLYELVGREPHESENECLERALSEMYGV